MLSYKVWHALYVIAVTISAVCIRYFHKVSASSGSGRLGVSHFISLETTTFWGRLIGSNRQPKKKKKTNSQTPFKMANDTVPVVWQEFIYGVIGFDKGLEFFATQKNSYKFCPYRSCDLNQCKTPRRWFKSIHICWVMDNLKESLVLLT